jgi:hypothetical protein
VRGRGGGGEKWTKARVLKLYKQACAGGDTGGCFALAELYAGTWMVAGSKVEQDLPRAASLYRKACESGLGIACVDLAILWDEGRAPAAAGDPVRVLTIGCDGGEASACELLGSLSAAGRGVPKDVTRAQALFKRGCALGKRALSCACASKPDACTAQVTDTAKLVGSPGVECTLAFAESMAARKITPRELRHAWVFLRTGNMPPDKSEAEPGGIDPARVPVVRELASHLQALALTSPKDRSGERLPPRVVAGDLIAYSIAWSDKDDAVVVARGNLEPVLTRLPITLVQQGTKTEIEHFRLSVGPPYANLRTLRPAMFWLRLRDDKLCAGGQ